MKIYFVVLDGAADRKTKELGNQTPLEYAQTPILDLLAKKGCQSMISVIDENIAPESDSGTMALLSYDPLIYYPGRGTLEGSGAGFLEKYKYSASFRINFASYNENEQILDRRTARGLSDAELQKLAEELRENIKFEEKDDLEFKLLAFGHHRGILSLLSNTTQLCGNVSNTDPGFEKRGCFSFPLSNYENKPKICRPLENSNAARMTAYYVNCFMEQAKRILDLSEVNYIRRKKGLLPANCILVRDGGSLPVKMPLFYDKYACSLVMYGQLPSEKAIADLIGADFVYTKALELQFDEEYLQKIAECLIEDGHDIKYIHLKGPDEPGHDKVPFEKVKAIEKIDTFFMQELFQGMKSEDIVIVTCDHATPCELGIHSSDKVPLLIYGNGILADSSEKFSEEEAGSGSGTITRAIDILPFLKFNSNR